MKNNYGEEKQKLGECRICCFVYQQQNKAFPLFFRSNPFFFMYKQRKKQQKKRKKKEESYKMYGEKQASSALQPFYHLLFLM